MYNDEFRQWGPAEQANFTRNLAPAPKQDPKLFEEIAVKVLKPFYVSGKIVTKDAVVRIPRHLAIDLRAIGKVELV